MALVDRLVGSTLRRGRPRFLGALTPLLLIPLLLETGCPDAFDAARSPAPRGTVGQELYGVICDRLGAQSLQEDLTGASFHAICHPDASGNYASTVDQTQLPAPSANAVNTDGLAVSLATQTADRAHAVARVQALAQGRANLIASFDAIFPAVQVATANLGASDPSQSCAPDGTAALSGQLADLLGRFQPLYDDGTIPQATESLALIFNAIKESAAAQNSFARFEARQGYRPIDLSLGVARPAVAYDGLRDFTNTALALLSADSQPYNTSQRDAKGNRVPIPGPANPQFNQLLAVAHDELAYATQDPSAQALSSTTDTGVNRAILNRPRTDLEVLEQLFYAHDPAYATPGGAPHYIALRDPRGYAQVALVNGALPAPFVDVGNATPVGLAAVDDAGAFITTNDAAPPTPFYTGNADGPRDTCGRALRTGASGSPSLDAGAGPSDCSSTDDQVLYDYIDTSSVFAASLIRNLKPLTVPEPLDGGAGDGGANHNTLMYALAGAPVLFGARDGALTSSKCYAPNPANPGDCADPTSLLKYDGFENDSSALLDLVYGLGQVLGDPTMDDTLAYVKALFGDQLGSVARLAGDALAMKATASQHPEAKIPASSTFWDEMLDVTVELEKQPGMLEDVLRALGTDGSESLGQIFANYMTYDDQMTYDEANLNGPPRNVTTGEVQTMVTPVDRSQPDTGFNRSAMQRFLSLIHDTNGVTACNQEGSTNGSSDSASWSGVVHAQGVLPPILNAVDVCGIDGGAGAFCKVPIINTATSGARPFHECEVFKIENLAKFYLDSIVEGVRDPPGPSAAANAKAVIYFRPSLLRNGLSVPLVGDVGAATVSVIEQSSGLGLDTTAAPNANDTYGFWDPTNTAQLFRPRPQWLNRLVFFDQVNDKSNATTKKFLADLQGPNIGSAVCPERVIPDPCNNQSGCGGNAAAGVSADGMVHGLRACADGDWLSQRGNGTIFVWEQFGFYQAITPLLNVFVTYGREDVFIDLMETLYRHWADARGTADECLISSDSTAKYQQCTKDGLETYEPLLAKNFAGDILPALHDLVPVLQAEKISHCTATDETGTPPTHLCTAEQTLDGIAVISNATRALVDPGQAAAISLVDRHKVATALRNDGSTNPQVTPIYLLTQALDNMDAAFANQATPDPNDDRFAQWRLARSQLVDQFLTIDGTGTSSTFDNVAIPKIVPTFIDVTRAQLFAHCPTSFATPFARCGWARDDLTTELGTVMHGPTFAASVDLVDALRKDPPSRAQLGALLQYLLDAGSSNDALPNLLASANDLVQVLKDDTNMVPLYTALAPGLQPSTDPYGKPLKSAVDASLALLGRLSGRAYGASGEVCSAELDPNQLMTFALKNLVTPMASSGSGNGETQQAPLQTIMDVIGDVNRADPSQATKFQGFDYATIADSVSSFLTDQQRGLEQFYAIVRNGTVDQ